MTEGSVHLGCPSKRRRGLWTLGRALQRTRAAASVVLHLLHMRSALRTLLLLVL